MEDNWELMKKRSKLTLILYFDQLFCPKTLNHTGTGLDLLTVYEEFSYYSVNDEIFLTKITYSNIQLPEVTRYLCLLSRSLFPSPHPICLTANKEIITSYGRQV